MRTNLKTKRAQLGFKQIRHCSFRACFTFNTKGVYAWRSDHRGQICDKLTAIDIKTAHSVSSN